MRQIKLGLYKKLDKSKLKNYKNLDTKLLEILKKQDSADEYSIPYAWGTLGLGYDKNILKSIDPKAPLASLKLIFDPKIVSQFSKCGVDILDSPEYVVPVALLYAGVDPSSVDINDLPRAEKVLMAIRPYVMSIHASKYISNLASGDSCLALGYSGDIWQAGNRAKELGGKTSVDYVLPKEGSEIGIDVAAILSTSKNTENAYKFLDFILRPDIAARNANYIGYPNGNKASYKMINKGMRDNKYIYPSESIMQKLYFPRAPSQSYKRARTRMWMKFKSNGQ